MSDKLNVIINRINKKNFGIRLFQFIMGILVGAFAFNIFFEPYKVIPTGSSGLSLLLLQFFHIDTSLMVFIVSLILLLCGLIFFGWDYSFKMLIITFLFPIFLKATTIITTKVDLEDTSLFLIMVFGGAMMGLSSGLIRKSSFNPGGFSVIYDLLNKYCHISIGMAGIITNGLLIILSVFVFGLISAIYALISLIVSSYIVDKVIIGISDNKVFYILTDKPLEVRDYVMDKLHYNVTVIKVRGGYSNKKRNMLMCVVPTIEYVKLKELVKEIDKDVFFLVVDTYESSIKKNCKNM